MRVLVLVLQSSTFEPVNNFFIPQSLFELGLEVVLGDVNSLQLVNGEIVVRSCEFHGSSIGQPHPQMTNLITCDSFDLCWFLDYPHPKLFDDYIRLLWILERKVPFVNTPASVFLLNNKIGSLGLRCAKYFASSSVLKESALLHSQRESTAESSWIIKPPDKGCGADVFILRPEDPNANALIDSAVGNPQQLYEMFGKEIIGKPEQYVVMQEFLPHLREEENRVLLAGGKIVGGYRKVASKSDFRGNYLVGASTDKLCLSNQMIDMSLEIASELLQYGITFAGIDISREHLIELNLVNPGGISGHLEATGENIGKEVCQTILKYLFKE